MVGGEVGVGNHNSSVSPLSLSMTPNCASFHLFLVPFTAGEWRLGNQCEGGSGGKEAGGSKEPMGPLNLLCSTLELKTTGSGS